MTLIRHIARQFDPAYITPSNLARALRQINPVNPTTPATPNARRSARKDDRRCGIDRRQKSHTVLLDLRSHYPRRQRNGRRQSENMTLGIDTYA